MKKFATMLALAGLLMCAGPVWAQDCDHTITLFDSYGDGWNGGAVDVLVNATTVLSGLTIDDGYGPESHVFQAATGDAITTVYTAGSYSTENYYYIYDTNGLEICADGEGGTTPVGCSCTGNCEAPPENGACCYPDGSCVDEPDQATCEGNGGAFEGGGTTCATTDCPQPPPPNDECANATDITAVPYEDTGVNMPTATDDGNVDPSCDSSSSCTAGGGWGVWYTYTPAVSCAATITVVGEDTSTSVWTGTDCATLTEEECSDPQTMEMNMNGGTTYWILVSKWSCYSAPTSAIDFSFDCEELPAGGACCYSDGSCTDEPDQATCEGAGGAYQGDGTACATTVCPSAGDSCGNPKVVTLGVSDLPYVDANSNCGRGNNHDDSSTAHCLYYYDSGEDMIYELDVTEAMTVRVLLDPGGTTYPGVAIGDACPPTDSCLAADYHSSADPLDTGCVTLDPGSYFIQVDTWASPDCIPDFTLTVEQCASGGACCHPDESCTDEPDQATCEAAGGLYMGDATTCETTVCPPPNDHCENATPIAIGGSASGNNGGADDDTQDYCGTSSVNQGVWYVVTGNGNELIAALCESDFDTKIQIWTSCDVDPGTDCVDGNDDSDYCDGKSSLIPRKEYFAPNKGGGRAVQSAVSWQSEAGVDYYIHVGGWSSSTGNYVLEIADLNPPPVPTLSEWGLVFVTLLGLIVAVILLRRFRAAQVAA